MAGPDVRTRRWTRIEYDRLIEAGFFRPGDPVELLGGQMVVAEPQGSRHFAALRATQEALRAVFGAGWEIRGRGPLALDDESEPEPDLAAVPGTFRDYRAAHPSSPSLVIEISDQRSLALSLTPSPFRALRPGGRGSARGRSGPGRKARPAPETWLRRSRAARHSCTPAWP